MFEALTLPQPLPAIREGRLFDCLIVFSRSLHLDGEHEDAAVEGDALVDAFVLPLRD